MSVPNPPSSLDGACTVIYNETLYSYFSDGGFASIRLEEGAEWKTLNKSGTKVTGATCVSSTKPANVDPAFFVVGGKTDDAAFTGLQMYTYSTGKWSTVTPSNLVTKHRQWHTSTYIPDVDTIVVYGGNQDGKDNPSTDTFAIGATKPYQVKILNPQPVPNGPPKSKNPILKPWSDSDAMLVGGGTTTDHSTVYWFNPSTGWRQSGATLAQPIAKDTSSIQATVVTGSDGSKNLVTFDLSASPNKVERFVLQDAKGVPVHGSKVVSTDGGSKRRRDLTLNNWPDYNSTFAPKDTRQNSAIADDSKGMVVFSGGSKDSQLAMFDTNKNGWVNATSFFSGKDEKDLTATSTSSFTTASSTTFSTSLSSTSSSIETTSSAASSPVPSSAPVDNGPSSNAILGITLGAIAGFLLILGLILVLLRCRNRRKQRAEAGRASDAPSSEKDMATFARNIKSPAFRGHKIQASQESYSSMAILMGRMNKDKSGGLTRKPSNDTFRSSVSSLHKQFKSTISKPIPQHMDHPALEGQDERGVAFAPTVAEPRPRNRPMEANDGTRRSSGWNRYWSGGSALQILGFGGAKRNTGDSEQSSQYSEAVNNPRATQDSATVPPLNFEGRPAVNSVNTGSPVVSQYNKGAPLTEGIAGTIERPVSDASSGYSSGVPESVNEIWDPIDAKKPWGANRAPSSAYASSTYETAAPKPPSGVSKQPQLAMASTSDMSWLNLGEQSRV